MLKSNCGPTHIFNYHPVSLQKRIQGFFQVKKQQPIFIKYFEGEFDNQIQTITDFKISRLINSWHDHEHIHCSVIRQTHLKDELKIFEAFYYFPYKKSIPFRERVYFFYPSLLSSKKKNNISNGDFTKTSREKFKIKKSL